MDTTTSSSFSIEKAVEMYWSLRRHGQSGVLARLSVEARYIAPTPQQRHALRAMLGKYDELSGAAAQNPARQIADAVGCSESA